MDPLFVVDARHHGKGPVIFAWHPQGTLLASSGSNRMVHIFTCHGQLLHTIKSLPTSSACTALEWDSLGLCLAIAQANSSVVVLWFTRQWKTRAVDVGVKDVTFVSWSKTGDYLALGTGKGTMCIYHRRTNEKVWAAGKHKRRINCGAWSYQNQLAYGSDDKQISVTSETGQIQDQVKVKCRPLDVAFGGKQDQDECIVSVNMDGRTILLYNLHDQENALELAFQTRYGKILSYRWFGDGYIMAGFTSGFIVVISTHAHEIGREQYCAKFHTGELRGIAHCAATHKLATCGDGCVKLIDMRDWRCWGVDSINAPDLQEIKTHRLAKEAGQLDSLSISENGRLLGVGSCSGCLYAYVVRSGAEDVSSLYPHASTALALRPLPLARAVLAGAGALAAALAGIAYALGVPVQDVASAVLRGEGEAAA
ncbi:unnamed protein product, partial [Scytosiphon promiscuus]